MSWNDLRKGRFSQERGEYLITFNTLERIAFFDNFERACLFCRQIALNEQRYQCTWLTWVLMPDHFHGLLRLESSESSLSKVVSGLKATSGYAVNKQLKRQGRFWQPAFHDRALRADDDRLAIARYIAGNPLRAELVSDLRDYPFWNAVYL